MGKARKYSPEFKAQVMLTIVSGQKSLAQVSREHGIKDSVLHRWKTQFLAGLPEIFAPGQPAQLKRLHERINDLERLAGRQALQLEIAKKASSILNSHPAENGS